MRTFSPALLSLMAIARTAKSDSVFPSGAPIEDSSEVSLSPANPASITHSYIVDRLNSAFGGENCLETTQENDPNGFGFLDGQNGTRRVACSVEVPGFSGLAEYFWYTDEPTERPKYLAVSYGYENGSSGLVDIDFSSDGCGMECVEPYFQAISLNTQDGGTVNNGSNIPSADPVITPTLNPTTTSPINAPVASIPSPTVAPVAPTNTPGVTIDDLMFGPVNPHAQSSNVQTSTRSKVDYIATNIRRRKRVDRTFFP